MQTQGTIGGRKALFCDPGCRESFREDRRHGLIYGPYRREDGSWFMDAEEMSRELGICAYCNHDLNAEEVLNAD